MASRPRPKLTAENDLLRQELQLRSEGFCWIAGVDEAGRGPLAGPVVAAAVVLPGRRELPGVFDSKQLSDRVRRELRKEILALCDVGIGIAESAEIDKWNILRATHIAMRRAVAALKKVDFVLVDGLPVKGFPVPARNLVKGDTLSASIAAASIIAKVTRDELMEAAAEKFPGYGFERHKGYGTAAHLAALRKLGPAPIHRRSFAPVRILLDPPPEQPELF